MLELLTKSHTQKSHSLTVIKEQAKQQLSSSTKCAIQTKKNSVNFKLFMFYSNSYYNTVC